MARNAHDGLEGSLVAEALERMAESPAQSLRQSLEIVRETAHQEALNSERPVEAALSRMEERIQEALSRAQERIQEALKESEDRAVAKSAEQSRQAFEKGKCAGRAEIKELEGRMQRLENSLKNALERVFPRLEWLVQQLEERSPPVSIAASPSTDPPSSPSNHPPPSRSSSSTISASPPSFSIRQDASRGRALIEAIQEGELEVVGRLLDEGVSVNFSDEDGWTPLHAAAQRAQADVVRLLVERGADVNASTYKGDTALQAAARNDITGRCVEALIAAGAHLNFQDIDGWTALHWATSCGKKRAARALLAAGASETIKPFPRNNFWRDP